MRLQRCKMRHGLSQEMVLLEAKNLIIISLRVLPVILNGALYKTL